MKELTKRQGEVLEFVVDHQARHGAPPTLHEICDRFGFASDNAARQHLRLIGLKGHLTKVPNAARGLRLSQAIPVRFTGTVRVPLVGRVAAGRPVTAVENISGYVALDSAMFRGKALFALRVSGDSMTGAGIHDGDLVIVRAQARAARGEIVVALLGDEATVKRYDEREGRVVLRPENPAFEEIVVADDRLDSFSLVGKVVGVMRKL